MRNLNAAAVALWLVMSSQAIAETPWEVHVKFGFTGTWTSSCDVPPSLPTMWYAITKGDGGTVRRTADRGPGLPPSTSVIDKAEFLTPTTIRIHETSNDPLDKPRAFDAVLEKVSGRVRTLESIRDDGTVLAKNGINIASGQPTRWIEKCRD